MLVENRDINWHDTDVQVQIFDTYARALYTYALRLCHDSILADHYVGDTFSKLLEYINNGEFPQKNLRSYLYQMMYHLVVDGVRDDKHYHDNSIDDVDVVDRGLSPVAQLESRSEMEQIIGLISDLDEGQRQVILLRFIEGFSVKETAEITGKSISGVKILQKRGIEKIRDSLGVEDVKPRGYSLVNTHNKKRSSSNPVLQTVPA